MRRVDLTAKRDKSRVVGIDPSAKAARRALPCPETPPQDRNGDGQHPDNGG